MYDILNDMPNVKHGLSKSKIHRTWYQMKTRCENKRSRSYVNYGGRGIRVLWDSFEGFVRDMQPSLNRYLRKHEENATTIERIDVNGDYCKGNCRWATPYEQRGNLRNNNFYSWKGKRLMLRDILKMEGMDTEKMKNRINARIFRGWTIEEAVNNKRYTRRMKRR